MIEHKEAFCLMLYRCDKCKANEMIWNSRDGVTPFIISCRFCDGQSMHSNFDLDIQLPTYKPFKGQSVFIDLTEEKAREYATKNVEVFWDDERMPMKDDYSSKKEAVEALMADFYSQVGRPDLVIFDGSNIPDFKEE